MTNYKISMYLSNFNQRGRKMNFKLNKLVSSIFEKKMLDSFHNDQIAVKIELLFDLGINVLMLLE